ncbi:hypothetical protein [Glutamicibacter sp. Je.9.36]
MSDEFFGKACRPVAGIFGHGNGGELLGCTGFSFDGPLRISP